MHYSETLPLHDRYHERDVQPLDLDDARAHDAPQVSPGQDQLGSKAIRCELTDE